MWDWQDCRLGVRVKCPREFYCDHIFHGPGYGDCGWGAAHKTAIREQFGRLLSVGEALALSIYANSLRAAHYLKEQGIGGQA
jgi:hypothetical protein